MPKAVLVAVAAVAVGLVALVTVAAVAFSRFELFSDECGGLVSSAPSAPGPTREERSELEQYGTLAYVSGGVWIVGADGTGRRRIVSIEALPPLRWSPDGRRIVFGDGRHLYLVDADGRHLVRLTGAAGRNVEPAWSPDGSRIAFSSDRRGNFDIYVMRADGARVRQVTRTAGVDHAPAWSPDGMLIAFQGRRASLNDPSGSIEIVNAAGSGRRRLKAPPVAFAPAWAPDGSRVAIGGRRAARHERIYVIDVGTGRMRRVGERWGVGFVDAIRHESRVTRPVWSPDGEDIAYAVSGVRRRASRSFVLVADADGGDADYVSDANDHRGAFDPVWSPDGEKLSFLGASDLEDGFALYSWRLGGYDERWCNDVRSLTPALRITASPGGGETLAWQPVR